MRELKGRNDVLLELNKLVHQVTIVDDTAFRGGEEKLLQLLSEFFLISQALKQLPGTSGLLSIRLKF